VPESTYFQARITVVLPVHPPLGGNYYLPASHQQSGRVGKGRRKGGTGILQAPSKGERSPDRVSPASPDKPRPPPTTPGRELYLSIRASPIRIFRRPSPPAPSRPLAASKPAARDRSRATPRYLGYPRLIALAFRVRQRDSA
jgi:hypothetical protein